MDPMMPGVMEERVYRLPQSAAASAVLWLVGGVTLLGFAVLGMVLAAVSRPDQLTLNLMTTLPAIMGVGAVIAGVMTARTPQEVSVGPAGVRVVNRKGSQTYGWDRVGWSVIEAAPLNNRRQLKLCDVQGNPIVTLSDAIEGFDELAGLVAARIAMKADDTAERIRMAKSKRSAVGMAAGGIAFLALSGAVAWMTNREIRAERLLKTAAVPGTARIERRFLAPNGVTPRLVYRVAAPDGRSATRNAEVERPVWDALGGAQTVPVLYVPGEPGISRLAAGEPEDRDPFKQPLIGYGMPAAVALMSVLFLVTSGLMWRGWDIDIDSKTGRISVKRFGTGR